MLLSKCRVWLYGILVRYHAWKYRFFYNMDIGAGTTISRKATIDRGINPQGVHIGKFTRIAGGVLIMAHDACRAMKADTYIGDYCFLGARCIIMPGVKIGNEVVIGSGAVVTKDVPSNCIVAGNPAKVIRENIHCGKMGVLIKELK